jgi:hypothetical protein
MTNEELLEVFKQIQVGDRIKFNNLSTNSESKCLLTWRVVVKTKDMVGIVWGKEHSILVFKPNDMTYNEAYGGIKKGRFFCSFIYQGFTLSDDKKQIDYDFTLSLHEIQKVLEKGNADDLFNKDKCKHTLCLRYAKELVNIQIVKKAKVNQ